MRIQIVSKNPDSVDRILRQYFIDGINTVGVYGSERFALRFVSSSPNMIQVKLAVDGTDVLSGQKADLSCSRMWVVRPYGTLELEAWPESHEGGARFVFTDVTSSVALHTHGDLSAKGYISAAIFTEGQPPVYRPTPRPRYLSMSAESKSVRDNGPAVGAGEYVEQRIGHAQGLIRPIFSQIVQVRYLWWDDLLAKLHEAGIQPGHPTGFESGKLADLGTTPRLTTERQTSRLNRFE